MNDDDKSAITITSPDQFEAAIVEPAIEAAVDVRGAWEFQTRGSTYDWRATSSSWRNNSTTKRANTAAV
ncbi:MULTISPECIES: hypothetical protein [Haloarcula]|uniref:hypothetical protein n=1 Tax=Haloarcula TaxID=2237 RepID=UPI0023E83332|nr:hypothetical protein [Halomicroarcula sp. SHR3]